MTLRIKFTEKGLAEIAPLNTKDSFNEQFKTECTSIDHVVGYTENKNFCIQR